MDRLGAMRLFAAVADAGSLSAAGRRLGMPLTTVSRRLAALEDDLGTRFVTRSTRRLTLTEQGRQYLDACRRIIEEVDAAEAQLSGTQGEPQGVLAITAPVVFGRLHVLPLVSDFLRRYPRIDVRMLLLDRPVDLIEEGLDIAVRIGALPELSADRHTCRRRAPSHMREPRLFGAARRADATRGACRPRLHHVHGGDARDAWNFSDGKKKSACACARGSSSTRPKLPSTRQKPGSASRACCRIRLLPHSPTDR